MRLLAPLQKVHLFFVSRLNGWRPAKKIFDGQMCLFTCPPSKCPFTCVPFDSLWLSRVLLHPLLQKDHCCLDWRVTVLLLMSPSFQNMLLGHSHCIIQWSVGKTHILWKKRISKTTGLPLKDWLEHLKLSPLLYIADRDNVCSFSCENNGHCVVPTNVTAKPLCHKSCSQLHQGLNGTQPV
jgi:hypothetical protein